MTGYLFEYASAAKSPTRMSRFLLHLLVRFSVPKQLFAPSKMMTDSPTDIDGVFAFKRQNVAKERFYSVVQFAAPTLRTIRWAHFVSPVLPRLPVEAIRLQNARRDWFSARRKAHL
jgi:hypothetical protein